MTADRKTLWKGRRGRFVWHVYRPTSPTLAPDPTRPAHCRWANNHMGDR